VPTDGLRSATVRQEAGTGGREREPFSNLPCPLTRFVGRALEIAEVKRLLAGTRLLTVTGAGGCGKSRLALEAVRELGAAFPDGIGWVELASLSDPGLVAQVVATTLGLREEGNRSLVMALTDHLKSRHFLLLLDNCEHLLEACARLVVAMLTACPHLQVLATSREPLRLPGETRYPTPSLLPEEAVHLFVDRAVAVQPGFALTHNNVAGVRELCVRLEGIPLAIELAAARVDVLTVEQIRQRLENRFCLLTGGYRSTSPRHRTLRALIDWSYDLLSEAEQTLLRRLSVFAGGWTLESA
jgi:non-specific serine/threonine protein kinase